MFILTKIADLVQIAPEDFGKQSHQAIEDNINTKYANKVVQKIGLFVCLWDILWTSEGLIGQGDGFVNVNVEFRMVVFRPFQGEVLMARIANQSREGISLATAFFHDIFIPFSELPDDTEFDPREQTWVWKVKSGDDGEGGEEAAPAEEAEEAAEMYFDNNEVVRFQVVSEEWHDQAPSGPQDSADQPASELLPPYKITGSMKAAGLGCTIWWD